MRFWRLKSSHALHPSPVPTAGGSQAVGMKPRNSVSWDDNGVAVRGILGHPRKNCSLCGQGCEGSWAAHLLQGNN